MHSSLLCCGQAIFSLIIVTDSIHFVVNGNSFSVPGGQFKFKMPLFSKWVFIWFIYRVTLTIVSLCKDFHLEINFPYMKNSVVSIFVHWSKLIGWCILVCKHPQWCIFGRLKHFTFDQTINSNKVLQIKRPFVYQIAMLMSSIQLRKFKRILRRMHKKRVAAVLHSTTHVVN